MNKWKIHVQDNRPEAEKLRIMWAEGLEKADLESILFHEFVTDADTHEEAVINVIHHPEWSNDMKIIKISKVEESEEKTDG